MYCVWNKHFPYCLVSGDFRSGEIFSRQGLPYLRRTFLSQLTTSHLSAVEKGGIQHQIWCLSLLVSHPLPYSASPLSNSSSASPNSDFNMMLFTMTSKGLYTSLNPQHSKLSLQTFLIVQWLRLSLPMQGTWVRPLVQEDSTCHGAAKPVLPDY